jgi:hypothetical protein
MIFIARKGVREDAPRLTRVRSLAPPYPDVRAVVEHSGHVLPLGAIDGSDWHLMDDTAAVRRRTMHAAGVPLSDYVGGRIYYGVKTGLNPAFVISGARRAELIARDAASEDLIKPFVTGRDIRRWSVAFGDRWLIYAYHGVPMVDYPAILNHLRSFKEDLEKRATKQEWYELQQPQMRYAREFDQVKIVFPDIASSSRFALDNAGRYMGDTTFLIRCEDLYLLGILNSDAVFALYMELSAQVRGGYLRYKRQYVEQIPIPNVSPTDRNAIADLAQKCLDARGQGPQVAEWEAELNGRVAVLYGLTGTDIG